jgi:ectoine hydroxylase-related dioxygenase (phytanoyl-CoA dioxygenase family)
MLGAKSGVGDLEILPDLPLRVVTERLLRFGAVVLRQALDRSRIETIAHDVEADFAALDRVRGTMTSQQRRELDRMEMPVIDSTTSFRLRFENYRVLDSDRLRAVAEARVGPFLWHFPPQFRRQRAEVSRALLPFHQDCAYLRHYGTSFLTCWVPLIACGLDAPGLELALEAPAEEVAHESWGDWEARIPHQVLEPLLVDRATYAPALEPGDAVLFDCRLLHRTHMQPGMTRERLSIDFRLVPVSAISPQVRSSRRFVDPHELKQV